MALASAVRVRWTAHSALGPWPWHPGLSCCRHLPCSPLLLGKERGPCPPSRATVLASSHKRKHSAHWSPRLGPPGRAWCRGWRGTGGKSVGPAAPAAPGPAAPDPPLPAGTPLTTNARRKPRAPASSSRGAAAAVQGPGRRRRGVCPAGTSPGTRGCGRAHAVRQGPRARQAVPGARKGMAGVWPSQ